MAKISSEQVNKINACCVNDWKFDTRYFLTHSGEKMLSKNIKLDNTNYLRCNLYFDESYNRYEKTLKIVLHISKYTGIENGFASSAGLGLFRSIPYNKPRKSFADLEKLTAVIDDNYIMEIYNKGNNSEKCLDNILLDSNGWHLHEV